MRGAEDEDGSAETTSVPHAMLAITDTGCGMTPDVMARIFEPFYTTKPVGVGTGLGLAMVFGVVRQSGGGIEVQSTPERARGSCCTSPPCPIPYPAEVVAADRHARGHWPRDDPDRRGRAERARTAAAQPCAHGYTLLTAMTAAMRCASPRRYKGAIDLVLTDVVMPRMGGPELVAVAARAAPRREGALHERLHRRCGGAAWAAEADVSFIQKPYTPLALARKIRDVLDDVPEAGAMRAQ